MSVLPLCKIVYQNIIVIMLEYSEYQDLVDILSRSNVENSYQDLMKKEDKVLDTVNSVVKYYKENKHDQYFFNRKVIEIVLGFFDEWSKIIQEIINGKFTLSSILSINRTIYVGMMIIILALILVYAAFL